MSARKIRTAAPGSLASLLAWPMLDQIPRLLGQVDRNMHSPTYGCCARNHWHYQSEDIANSRMQEMALALALAWKLDLPDNPYYRSPLLIDWTEGVLDFTMRIQRPDGSFDESYRGEQSFTATAFVAFHISETVAQLERHLTSGVRNEAKVMLDRAGAWLGRPHAAASGSALAASAAAFTNLAALDPDLGYDEDLERMLDALEGLQSAEGWFPEPDGADIGAASIAQSFLALIAKRTGNKRALAMALKSAAFLQHFLHRDGTAGGVYGGGNTEYFVPLGAVLHAGKCEASARMTDHVARHLELGSHAVITRCLDDRSLALFSPFYLLSAQAALETAGAAPLQPGTLSGAVHFAEAGLWSVETPSLKLVANLKKGGVFHLDLEGSSFVDCGYFAEIPDGPIVTTQAPGESRDIATDGLTARLSARLVVLRPEVITPWKSIRTRFFRFVTPALLRRILDERARRHKAEPALFVGSVHRNIVVSENAVDVTDFIEVTEPVVRMVLQLDTERAGSSANAGGFYQPQELNRDGGILQVDLDAGKVVVQRRYDREGLTLLS